MEMAETRHQKVLDMVGTVEAARILGVDIATVQNWFDRGLIPGVLVPGARAGSRRLMKRVAVEQLARERAALKS